MVETENVLKKETGGKDLSGISCYACGESGHYANKCPNPTAKKEYVNRLTTELKAFDLEEEEMGSEEDKSDGSTNSLNGEA